MRYVAVLLTLMALVPSVCLRAQPTPAPACLAVVDDLNLEFRSTPALRQVAGQLLGGLAQQGFYCSVTTTSGTLGAVTPVSMATAQSAASMLLGSGLRPADLITGGQQQNVERNHRKQTAFAIAATAIDIVAKQRGGRAFPVLFFSGGYAEPMATANDLVSAAIAAGAVVYAIDPRAFGGAMQNPGVTQNDWDAYLTVTKDSLSTLGARTKGSAVFTQSDLTALQSRLLSSIQ
jgi:hypothetical protein